MSVHSGGLIDNIGITHWTNGLKVDYNGEIIRAIALVRIGDSKFYHVTIEEDYNSLASGDPVNRSYDYGSKMKDDYKEDRGRETKKVSTINDEKYKSKAFSYAPIFGDLRMKNKIYSVPIGEYVLVELEDNILRVLCAGHYRYMDKAMLNR